MTTTINGTTGIDLIKDGSVSQADLGANVAGNGPAFIAQGVTSSITFIDNAYTTLINLPEVLDTANCYDPVTGIFTPNVAGWYQVNAAVQVGGAFTISYGNIQLLGSTFAYAGGLAVGATEIGYATGSVSGLFYFNGSSDTVRVKLGHDSAATRVGVVSAQFSGYLARSA